MPPEDKPPDQTMRPEPGVIGGASDIGKTPELGPTGIGAGIKREDGAPIRQLRPKRLEFGIVAHETTKQEFVKLLANGDVNGVPIRIELSRNKQTIFISILDKHKGISLYRYKLLLAELAGGIVSTHFKDWNLRPDPEAGDEMPMLLGVKMDPFPKSTQD